MESSRADKPSRFGKILPRFFGKYSRSSLLSAENPWTVQSFAEVIENSVELITVDFISQVFLEPSEPQSVYLILSHGPPVLDADGKREEESIPVDVDALGASRWQTN